MMFCFVMTHKVYRLFGKHYGQYSSNDTSLNRSWGSTDQHFSKKETDNSPSHLTHSNQSKQISRKKRCSNRLHCCYILSTEVHWAFGAKTKAQMLESVNVFKVTDTLVTCCLCSCKIRKITSGIQTNVKFALVASVSLISIQSSSVGSMSASLPEQFWGK